MPDMAKKVDPAYRTGFLSSVTFMPVVNTSHEKRVATRAKTEREKTTFGDLKKVNVSWSKQGTGNDNSD